MWAASTSPRSCNPCRQRHRTVQGVDHAAENLYPEVKVVLAVYTTNDKVDRVCNMHWVKENKIANGVCSDVIQKFHTDVPYFQNVLGYHGKHFFIAVPCILLSIQFIHQQTHCLLNLIKF